MATRGAKTSSEELLGGKDRPIMKANGRFTGGVRISSGGKPDLHQPARARVEIAHFKHDSETMSCVEGFCWQAGGNGRKATVAVASRTIPRDSIPRVLRYCRAIKRHSVTWRNWTVVRTVNHAEADTCGALVVYDFEGVGIL